MSRNSGSGGRYAGAMDWLGLSVIVALFRLYGKENRRMIRTGDCYFSGNQ
jgi:hypothetical protein